ncbi:hypothetical protein [Leifsonia aquatica]|uniref:hypothetical protein n=1 Tax=Leifsonia aquatica TaxID=144185 RepID=UPI000469F1CC|nr:hypothetical protein [Leifsonia aquatica]
MTQWYVFETMTGTVLREFVPSSGSWKARVNEPETVDVQLDLSDPQIAAMDWRNLGTPWKHSIAVDEGGRLYGGPIQPHDYTPGEPLQIVARGIRALTARRTVLPPAALTQPLVSADGSPNTALDTNLSGLDFGSIGRFLVWQMCQWPGSGLPIVFEDPRAGTRVRNYAAVDLKNIDEALAQLSGVERGPDFAFRLRWRPDGKLEWVMTSGTEASPLLIGPNPPQWDVNASRTSGADLAVKTNPAQMGALSWATAGRGDDKVMMSRAYDPALTNAGVPLLELVDNSHTSVEFQDTLDGYARAGLRTGGRPSEFWSFKASLLSTPWLRDFYEGDYCDIFIQDDPYLPPTPARRRILELSGDDEGLWVSITCGEAFDG